VAFRADCSSEEWLEFTIPFFGVFHTIAPADGKVDKKELKLLKSLREGREANRLLHPFAYEDHLRLAKSGLAHDVLEMGDPQVLSAIDSGEADPLFRPGAFGVAAQAYISRDPSEFRIAQARGLVFEIIHFGWRVADVSGKIADKQFDLLVTTAQVYGGGLDLKTNDEISRVISCAQVTNR